jgi:hypothetical protein
MKIKEANQDIVDANPGVTIKNMNVKLVKKST